MNANLDVKDGVIYWTGIPSDRLTHEQLLRAFLVLARADLSRAPFRDDAPSTVTTSMAGLNPSMTNYDPKL